jgi:hypothetical protein
VKSLKREDGGRATLAPLLSCYHHCGALNPLPSSIIKISRNIRYAFPRKKYFYKMKINSDFMYANTHQ